MIIQRSAQVILVVAQPDHARLAGVFARAGHQKPNPSLLAAAHHHDDGWLTWEAAPTIDERGRPHDFLTVPMDERVAIYRRGIDLVAGADPYAGLLTSMHFSRLLAEGLGSLEGAPRRVAEAFLAGQVAWEVRTRRELGEPSGAEADYLLLRGFDFLSLLLCMRPLEELAGTTLPPIHERSEEPARPTAIDVVDGRVVLDPYPFGPAKHTGPEGSTGNEALDVAVEARLLPATTFDSDQAYRSALAAAPVEELRFTLTPPAR